MKSVPIRAPSHFGLHRSDADFMNDCAMSPAESQEISQKIRNSSPKDAEKSEKREKIIPLSRDSKNQADVFLYTDEGMIFFSVQSLRAILLYAFSGGKSRNFSKNSKFFAERRGKITARKYGRLEKRSTIVFREFVAQPNSVAGQHFKSSRMIIARRKKSVKHSQRKKKREKK